MGLEAEMSNEEKPAKKEYFFFVGTTKYETELAEVTGAYVKSRIADFPDKGGLELEGQGNDPDTPFGDNDKVSLALGHGQGPRRFNIVPPANFG
jgi:hypothetical protein